MSNNTILFKINGDASGFEKAVNRSIGLSRSFAGAVGLSFGVAGMVAFTKQLIDISDKYTQLDGRLKLVTKSTAEFQTAQSGLYKVAQDTRVSYESTVDLYTRMARSTGELGISQKELIGITESINKALIVSGASGESASAALMQLGQGMASGALRGEELNSVMEQTPRLAQMIADGLGVGIGQLREMGKEGRLTSEVLIGALQKGAAKVNEEFGKMPETVGQAMTTLTNVFESVVNQSNNAAGATQSLAGAIGEIATTIDQNRDGIINSFVAIANAVNWAAERVAALGNAVALFNQMRAGKVSVGSWLTADDQDAKRLLGQRRTTEQIYGLSLTPRVGNDFSAMSTTRHSNGRSTAGGGTSASSARRSSTSKGATDADRLSDRADALRESLATEIELEDQRYAESAKLLAEHFVEKGVLTAEGNDLAIKLAEDHAKKMDEIAGVAKWNTDLEALQDKYKTEAELEDERYKEQLDKLAEFKDAELVTKEDYLKMEQDALAAHQQEIARIQQAQADKEKQVQESIRNMRLQTAQMGVNLLQMFAGKSKAAALAAIALSKGLMIAQTIQSTAAAKMRAMAELGPIAGPPAAASIAAMGAIQVGLIAATGLVEAAQATSGGSGGLSSASTGTSYTTDSSGTTTAATTTSNKTITVYGLNKDDLFTGAQVAELLNDYMADGGKLIIK